MAKEKRGLMKGAYELQSADDNRAHYDKWADSYEDSMREYRYVAPQKAAELLARFVGGGEVLDVGCGTGLAAAALAARGDFVIDGVDISPQMLAAANDKNLYRRLREGNLLDGLDIADASYDAAISVGAFTVGHVGPGALPEMFRLVKPGGAAVLTVNEMVYEKEKYPAHLARWESEQKIVLLAQFYDSYIAETDTGGHYLALRMRRPRAL